MDLLAEEADHDLVPGERQGSRLVGSGSRRRTPGGQTG
jgi:hypothetical protein